MKALALILILLCAAHATAQDLNPTHYAVPTVDSMNVQPTVVIQPSATISVATTNFNVTWPASPDPLANGYDLYWGTVAGQYTCVMHLDNVTNATVFNLPTGRTYHFVVITRAASGWIDSDASPEAVAPSPWTLDLRFANPGTQLFSHPRLEPDNQTWSVRGNSLLTSDGVWHVLANPGVRQEFFRAK